MVEKVALELETTTLNHRKDKYLVIHVCCLNILVTLSSMAILRFHGRHGNPNTPPMGFCLCF